MNENPCVKCGATDRDARGDCRVCAKNWRITNAATRRAKTAARYWANPVAGARYQREWREAHPESARATRLKQYNVSPAEYEDQLASQGGVCAICGKPETVIDKRTGKVRALVVDHCHKTNNPRALLCNRCNVGIARFEEDPELLEAAARYLRCFTPGLLVLDNPSATAPDPASPLSEKLYQAVE